MDIKVDTSEASDDLMTCTALPLPLSLASSISSTGASSSSEAISSDPTPASTTDDEGATSAAPTPTNAASTSHSLSGRHRSSKQRVHRCRICLSSRQTNKSRQLIAPCSCKGSVKYVHLNCLQRWRSSTRRALSYYQCENCTAEYRLDELPYVSFKSATLDYFAANPQKATQHLNQQQSQQLMLQLKIRRKYLHSIQQPLTHPFDIHHHWRFPTTAATGMRSFQQFTWRRNVIVDLYHLFRYACNVLVPRDILLPLLTVAVCIFTEYRVGHQYEVLQSLVLTTQFIAMSLLLIPIIAAIKHLANIVFQIESDWWHDET